jgi:hypothetical protein
MFRNYKSEGFNVELLKYYSMQQCNVYGTPYDDNWDLLVSIFDEHDLVKSEGVNYVWAELEAEKIHRENGELPYAWKYQK